MADDRNDIDRDQAGRFRAGASSPNPKGRPRKAKDVDAALMGALSEKVMVTEQGKRKRKSKLDIAATQLVNKGASGDLRATKLVFDQARKTEERNETRAPRTPVMTKTDHEIAARVVARLATLLREGTSDDLS